MDQAIEVSANLHNKVSKSEDPWKKGEIKVAMQFADGVIQARLPSCCASCIKTGRSRAERQVVITKRVPVV